MSVFLRGLIIGFSIAAPVGPIGVLCIRRTLAEGRLTGFLSGMGAASADMFYGVVAAFGLTVVQELLIGHPDPGRGNPQDRSARPGGRSLQGRVRRPAGSGKLS